MPAAQDDLSAHQGALDKLRAKLALLTDLELVTLSRMALRGTANLEAEWNLIVKQIAANDAARLKKKHND